MALCGEEKSLLPSDFAEACREDLGILSLNSYFIFIIDIPAFENVLIFAMHSIAEASVKLMAGLTLVLGLLLLVLLLLLMLLLLLVGLLLRLPHGVLLHCIFKFRMREIAGASSKELAFQSELAGRLVGHWWSRTAVVHWSGPS